MLHKQINQWFGQSVAMERIVPISRFLTEHIFVTKEGGYGCVLQPDGIDSENLSREQLDAITEKIVAAKNALPERAVVYEYLIKKRGFDLSQMAGNSSSQPVGKLISQERVAHLERTANFGSIACHWCLYIPPEKGKKPGEIVAGQQIAIKQLRKATAHLQEQLKGVVRSKLLGEHEVAQLFSYLLSLEQHLATKKLVSAHHVDRQIVTSHLKWEGDCLKLGRRYLQMFSLRNRPKGTRPNLFHRLLALDCDMVLRSRWSAKETHVTRKEVHRQEGFLAFFRHSLMTTVMSARAGVEPPKTASSVAHDKATDTLGGVLIDIENEGRKYGDYSLIGMVHSRDLEKVQDVMPQIHGIFQDPSEASILEETDGAMSAYYALFPGNDKYDVRRCWMKDEHAGNLSLVYAPTTGNPYSKSLGGESLAVFETRDVTPYFFDPFVNGLRGLLIAGESGRGKSFLLNFLCINELKHNPFLYIFDIGKSYESTVLAAGGVMTSVGLDGPRINPFSLEPTDENIQFLFGFIRMLIAKGGVQVKPEHEAQLADKIRDMYLLSRSVRRLGNLVLPRYMQQGLAKWTEGGIYGRTFDNLEDSLHLARVQCFDFSGIDGKNHADLLEPILFWIVQRTNAVIQDQANLRFPKHLVFDEVWKSMKNPQLLGMIIEGLKTGRKNRYGVTLATQSMLDLGEHADIIKNSCPMALLLGETVVDREKYKSFFDLNDEEVDNVISLLPMKESFLKTPTGSKVLRLNVDATSHALFTTDPDDKQRRQELVDAHGFEEGIKLFAATANA